MDQNGRASDRQYLGKDNASYEIEEIAISGYKETTLKKVSNLAIPGGNEGGPTLVIHENVFLFSIEGLGYFHTMNDVVAEFNFIKRLVQPEEINFCAIAPSFDMGQDTISRYPFISNILDRLGISHYGDQTNNIKILDDYSEIIISAAYFIYMNYSPLLYRNIEEFYQEPQNVPDMQVRFNEYLSYSSRYSREFWNDLLSDEMMEPKRKIYLTRRKENDELRKYYKDCMVDGTFSREAFEQKWPNMKEEFIEDIENRSYQRYISLYDENQIENFLMDHGYEIIDPSSLSISEQLLLYSSAQEIVGFAGSNLYNCIFAHPEATITILNTSNSYNFWHRELIQSAIQNVYEAPPRSRDPRGNEFFADKGSEDFVQYSAQSIMDAFWQVRG